MVEKRQKFDEDFKAGAVRIVRETGKPIAQVARELGVNDGATDARRIGGVAGTGAVRVGACGADSAAQGAR